VFAAGNPLGVGLTVTMGIVSATGRTNLGILDEPGSYEHFIQTDAAINMGNSGGALIDSEGRLAGINTAIYSRTGGNIGIGFAIPINLAKSILVSLVEKGNVDRGFLGVNLEDIDSETAAKLKLPSSSGAKVNSVVPGSPADDAGLREGDVIVSLGDQPVRSVAELRVFISRTPPGEPIRLGWFREGRRKSFEIKLGRLGSNARAVESPLLPGLTLQPLDADLRSRFSVPRVVSGLVVTNSSGTVRSLREGVVIIEINGTSVATLEQAKNRVEQGLNRLYVWFRGSYSFVPYRVP
jgi:serine protease Do/serine protease DegQ